MYEPRKLATAGRRRDQETGRNRIVKLLASEYSDFSDTVLVESPFAETTRNGRGVRQVSLALTPTKLIVAADVFRRNSEFFCPRGLDPSIESFELVSVYPLRCVALSVFSRRHRKTLKARFIDGRASYYELGGVRRRKVSWEKWCEQVERLLTESMDRSSLSETTAGSSSSTTTLYVLSSDVEIRKEAKKKGKKVCRVWAHYGGAGDFAPPTWPDKDLYLGPSYNELSDGRYAPVPIRFAGASLEEIKDELKDYSPSHVEKSSRSWPTCKCYEKKRQTAAGLCDVLFVRDHRHKHSNASKHFATSQSCPCNHFHGRAVIDDRCDEKRNVWYEEEAMDEASIQDELRDRANSPEECLARRISRFGFGVPEKCHSGLVLGPTRRNPYCHPSKSSKKSSLNFYVLMESGVKVWEGEGKGRGKSLKTFRHFRRYGLCTAAHFFHALGPWSVQPGERSSLQGRRSFSLVTVRRQPTESELRLPVSRRQLSASVSYTSLQSGRFGAIGATAKGRVVLFWTPEFWYRPRPATTAYRELRRHLSLLRNYRQGKERPMKRKLFSRRKKCQDEEDSFIVAEEKPSFLERIFSGNGSGKRKKKHESQENCTTMQLRRLLRMDFRITVWDIGSSTLATQLTLIDRDLFVRIPAEEVEILVFQRSSKNAPNLGAWIAFSHRISCLTVSEILAVKKLDVRCRIIARFINAANKCLTVGNFHSCRSILAGLQAPPIYRLRKSWAYLRAHHASRYETMEKLCKVYRTPCTASYQRAWTKAEQNPPSMPYVGDLFARILALANTKRHRGGSIIYQAVDKLVPRRFKDPTIESRDTEDSAEQKQGLGKRIFASVFSKIKCKQDQDPILAERTDLPWTSREQELAYKYFYRWTNVVLKRKAWMKEEERSRDMNPRMKRVLDVVSWLLDCQKRAQRYDFPGHSFTREFLLKTRYREDRENFFISLKLEPSKIT